MDWRGEGRGNGSGGGGVGQSNQGGEAMSKILLPIGELMLLLGIFIALWDIRNEFLLGLLGGGLLMLVVGLASS
jgi:hypothetical protein